MKITINKNTVCLCILIILYLTVRLVILFLGTKEIYGGDEICYGAVAKELIQGPVLPAYCFFPSNYSGGQYIMPFLMVPFFIVFGPSYLALKLASLLFPFSIFIILYLFLCKFFNLRVAFLTSILLILSPPSYTRMSFLAIGTHMESSLFTIIALYVFYKLFFYENQETSNNYYLKAYSILFGLISGFGCFFSYLFIIVLLTLFILLFAFNKKLFLTKNFVLFVFSFLIGFSPWLYKNIFVTHFGGIDLLKKGFLRSSPDMINISQFFHRVTLFPSFIMQSMYFKNIGLISEDLLSYTYFFIFCISYLTLAWKNRLVIAHFFQMFFSFKEYQINFAHSAKEAFFLAYPLIFLFIYAFSNFKLGEFRYLMPVYPFMFIPISLFIDSLWRKKYKYYSYFAALIITVLMLIGILGNSSLISCVGFKRMNQYKGFRYYMMIRKPVKKYRFNLEKYINAIDKLDKLEKREVYMALAKEIADRLRGNEDKWLNYVNKINPIYKPYFYNALGIQGKELFGQDVDKMIYLINHTEEKYRSFLYKGLMQTVVEKFDGDADKCIEFLYSIDNSYKFNIADLWCAIICRKFSARDLFSEEIVKLTEKAPSAYRPYVYEELGKLIGIDFVEDFSIRLKNLDTERVSSFASLIPEENRVYLYKGFGEGIVENFNEFLVLDIADQIYPNYRAYVYKGIGKGFVWVYGEDVNIILKKIDSQLDMEYRLFLYEGIGLIN